MSDDRRPESDDEPVDDEPDDGFTVVSGLSWPRIAILCAAVAFLGYAVGAFLHRHDHPGSDSVDVGFYTDMIVHHEQALQMSQCELANGLDPTVRSFAMEVLLFQAEEIGVMETTLDEWGFRRKRPDTVMAWMGMELPVEQMPGLATQEQMDRLCDAEGSGADALFLELMAAHHEGGIHMAEYAGRNAGTGDVREMGQRMARNQAIEVNEFAMTAERLGFPVQIDRVAVPAD